MVYVMGRTITLSFCQMRSSHSLGRKHRKSTDFFTRKLVEWRREGDSNPRYGF